MKHSSFSTDGNMSLRTPPVKLSGSLDRPLPSQLRATLFLEQRFTDLHVVPPSSKNWILGASRLPSASNSFPSANFFPTCSSFFIYFFLISKSSVSNFAFQLKKFSIVTEMPWINCFLASFAYLHSFFHFFFLIIFICLTISFTFSCTVNT